MTSQSRYSIVERLTETKLKLMREKSELNSNVVRQDQRLSQLQKELADWEEDVKNQIETERRNRNRQITSQEQTLSHAKSQAEGRRAAIDEEIEAVNSALEAIKEISADAVAQAE